MGRWADDRGRGDATIYGVRQDSVRTCPFHFVSRYCCCWSLWLLVITLLLSDALALFALVVVSPFAVVSLIGPIYAFAGGYS